MATSASERETILQAIEAWPIEEQETLARMILQRVAAFNAARQPSQHQAGALERSTWDALYGAASNGQEPPSDEQVAQWLDERRMRKYGR